MAKDEPDAALVAIFKQLPVKNEARSVAEGRPIYDDLEVVEIRRPGSDARGVYPATSFSHWATDLNTGEQRRVTYAERFAHQFRQFKEQVQQTKTGTPLDYAPFLTEGKRAELRALNIFTVEALAEIDGQPLKNLGINGRDFKNRAMEPIADSRAGVANRELMVELEQLKARNALLEEDMKTSLQRRDNEGEFETMSLDQLREYIAAQTGHSPQGSLTRRTLVQMAKDARPERAA